MESLIYVIAFVVVVGYGAAFFIKKLTAKCPNCNGSMVLGNDGHMICVDCDYVVHLKR